MKTGKSIASRFLKKVSKSNDCWNWKAGKNPAGYGRFNVSGKNELAHRVSYKIHIGKIPAGLYVLHSCDNPSCVNPEHLWIGSGSDNIRDMDKKGRRVVVPCPGERNGYSKLTNRAVGFIRKNKHKLTRRLLAKRFGVCMSTISYVWGFRIWRHI